MAICISIKSICMMSLLFFEIIELNSWSKSCRANFVLSKILVSFSGSCLCTYISLGKIKDETKGCWFIQVFLECCFSSLGGVSFIIDDAWINHMSYLIDGYYMHRCVTMIHGISLPLCMFRGTMTLSGLILIIVHRKLVGSLVLDILGIGTTKGFGPRWIVYQLGCSNNYSL